MSKPKSEILHIRREEHNSIVFAEINNYYQNQLFCDVSLSCTNGTLKCHRLVLAASSPYFEEIINNNSNFDALVIFIHGADFHDLTKVIEYVYFGNVNLTPRQLVRFEKLAVDLQIRGLKVPNFDNCQYEFGSFESSEKVGSSYVLDNNDLPPVGDPSGLTEEDYDCENDLEMIEVSQDTFNMNDCEVTEIDRSQENKIKREVLQPQYNLSTRKYAPSCRGYDAELCKDAFEFLMSGATLSSCQKVYGIHRKTLTKWKKESSNMSAAHTNMRQPAKINWISKPERKTDRKYRLEAATNMAMNGTTVRQAAIAVDIPRSTLCAYMKRSGRQTPRQRINFYLKSKMPVLKAPSFTPGVNNKMAVDENLSAFNMHFMFVPENNINEEVRHQEEVNSKIDND